jgi:hypothetical protein
MANKIKVEVFLSVPACSGGMSLMRLMKDIESEYGDQLDIQVYRGRNEMYDKYSLTAAPAVVVGDLVRMMGVCPDKESMVAALKECGLD